MFPISEMDLIIGTSSSRGSTPQSFQPPDLAAHYSTARDRNVDRSITVGMLMLLTMHLHPIIERRHVLYKPHHSHA